jgi:hypothetical protein
LQGFAKIHDRYEFPLILDLNEFVAPSTLATEKPEEDSSEGGSDAPEDAEKEVSPPVNNVFRLHSVLVHSVSIFRALTTVS